MSVILKNTVVCMAVGVAFAVALGTAESTSAVILSYDSGVTAAGGNAGAADPATQGWTYSGSGSGYADGYDSGNGGWRLVDGTTGNFTAFSTTPDSNATAALTTAGGWQLSWTLALDRSALLEGGGGVANYYAGQGVSRQNSQYMILQIPNEYNFYFSHRLDDNDQVFIRNELDTSQTYATGVSLGTSDTTPNFLTLTLTYDDATNTASFDHVGGTTVIQNGSTTSSNRLFWGSGSSAGQGSAIWNEVTLETVAVPEPHAALLAVLGAVGMIAGRFGRRCDR